MNRLLLFCVASAVAAAPGAGYTYQRIGDKRDIATKPSPGFFLAGGGADLDEGFEWLCNKANGGDLLILRATGDDAYNPYVRGFCPELNSVATLVISTRDGAMQEFVAGKIRQAEALFIAGGDQANYIRIWKGTPVQDAINARIANGVPIGGTSAGLDVLPQFVYSALNGTVTSSEALANPYHERVTLARGFLSIRPLANTITDAHVDTRNRLGRDVAFLARIVQQGWANPVSGIFIDERTAVLIDIDGNARVAGHGAANFVRATGRPEVCEPGKPLTFRNVSSYRVSKGGAFNLRTWRGSGGTYYDLPVENGKLVTQARPLRSGLLPQPVHQIQ